MSAMGQEATFLTATAYGNWELTFRPNSEVASASIGSRGQRFAQGLLSPSIEFLRPVAALGDPREQFGSEPLTIR
jgi:hypothetical protein